MKAQDPKAASRATWHRYKDDVEDLMLVARRPERIILNRNSPPEEQRPFDSPVGDAGIESEQGLA